MKKITEPSNAMYLLPVILATCFDSSGNDNIISIAWTTNLCKKPPCLCIVINGEKYSTKIIKEEKLIIEDFHKKYN